VRQVLWRISPRPAGSRGDSPDHFSYWLPALTGHDKILISYGPVVAYAEMETEFRSPVYLSEPYSAPDSLITLEPQNRGRRLSGALLGRLTCRVPA
jgi:hypothetical protein